MGRGSRDDVSQDQPRRRDARIAAMTLSDAIYYDTTGGTIVRDFGPDQFEAVLRRMDALFKHAVANPTLEWLEYCRRQARLRPVGTMAVVDQVLA